MTDKADLGNARGEQWLQQEDAEAAEEIAEAKADILRRLKDAGSTVLRSSTTVKVMTARSKKCGSLIRNRSVLSCLSCRTKTA